jgi:hypothetical protein
MGIFLQEPVITQLCVGHWSIHDTKLIAETKRVILMQF